MRSRTEKPIRLGAMAPARNRRSEVPTYQQILTKYGFLERNTAVEEASSVWQRICEDRTVNKMAGDIEEPKHRILATITAGYSRYGKVLSLLTSRQMVSLKKRIQRP